MSMAGQRPCRSGSPHGVRGVVQTFPVFAAAVALEPAAGPWPAATATNEVHATAVAASDDVKNRICMGSPLFSEPAGRRRIVYSHATLRPRPARVKQAMHCVHTTRP